VSDPKSAGLLQTADHARAIIRAIRFDLPPEAGDPVPDDRWPKIMHVQIKSLIEMASLPDVTLQLLPSTNSEALGLKERQ
jgi:hypothetical protein